MLLCDTGMDILQRFLALPLFAPDDGANPTTGNNRTQKTEEASSANNPPSKETPDSGCKAKSIKPQGATQNQEAAMVQLRRFLNDIIAPVTGQPTEGINSSYTFNTSSSDQKINFTHHVEEDNVTFTYDIVLSTDPEISLSGPELTVNNGGKTISANLKIPLPETESGWNKKTKKKIQDAYRAMTIADTKLYKRYLSKRIELEDFQEAAVEAALNDLKNNKRAFIVLPTGTGKTVTAWALMDKYLESLKESEESKAGKVLFVVNNKLILEEAEDKLHTQFPQKYKTSRIYGNEIDWSGDVVFATPASLNNNLEAMFEKGVKIAKVIYDEAHHLPANICLTTYEKIIKHDLNTAVLGLSATPERMDGKDVLQHFTGKISYQLDLDEATRRGFLPRWKIDEYRPKTYRHGDTVGNIAENEYRTGNKIVSYHKILDAYQKGNGTENDAQTLIMAPSVEEADNIASFLRRNGLKAVALTGKTRSGEIAGLDNDDKKARYFDDNYHAWKNKKWPEDSPFNNEKIPNIAVGVELFREGVDIPGIELLILARYTDSLPLLTQIVGRGLRPAPYKTKLKIADLVGQINQLDLIAYLADLVEERAKRLKRSAEQCLEDATKDGTINLEGLELDKDGTETLINFFKDIPLQLARRYQNYEKVKDHEVELKKLDRYLASKLCPEAEDNWRRALTEKLNALDSQIIEANDAQAIEAIRNDLKPIFYPNLTKPEDYGTRMPITRASQIVFERLVELCQTDRKILQESILPEFKGVINASLPHLSNNLKFLREKYFKQDSTEKMLNKLKDNLYEKLDEFSPEREVLDDFAVDLDNYGLCHDFAYAEGKAAVKEKTNLYGPDTRRFLGTRLVNLYLNYENLNQKLEPEDFGLHPINFRYKLASCELLDDEEAQKAYLDQIKTSFNYYTLTFSESNLENFMGNATEPLNNPNFVELFRKGDGKYIKHLKKIVSSTEEKLKELQCQVENEELLGTIKLSEKLIYIRNKNIEVLTEFKNLLESKIADIAYIDRKDLEDKNLLFRRTGPDEYELVLRTKQKEEVAACPVKVYNDNSNNRYIFVGERSSFLKKMKHDTNLPDNFTRSAAEILSEYFTDRNQNIFLVYKNAVLDKLGAALVDKDCNVLSGCTFASAGGITDKNSFNADSSRIPNLNIEARTGGTIQAPSLDFITSAAHFLNEQKEKAQTCITTLSAIRNDAAQFIADELKKYLESSDLLKAFTSPAMDFILERANLARLEELQFFALSTIFLLGGLDYNYQIKQNKNNFYKLFDSYKKLISREDTLTETSKIKLQKFVKKYIYLIKEKDLAPALNQCKDLSTDLQSLVDTISPPEKPKEVRTGPQAYFTKTAEGDTIKVLALSNMFCKVSRDDDSFKVSIEISRRKSNGTVHLDPTCEKFTNALDKRIEHEKANKALKTKYPKTSRYVSLDTFKKDVPIFSVCKDCCKDSEGNAIDKKNFKAFVTNNLSSQEATNDNTLEIDDALIYHF